MLFLGIDQHARQLTVSLRDQNGDVILARQVSTQPEKILDFFDQLTRCCAQRQEPFGSVDENPISATAFADNGLQQTPNSGCSPGCRNSRLCESAAGVDCQQVDPQLLKVVESWPRLSPPIKAALITMIEAAIPT